jgi:hypothetical protein
MRPGPRQAALHAAWAQAVQWVWRPELPLLAGSLPAAVVLRP